MPPKPPKKPFRPGKPGAGRPGAKKPFKRDDRPARDENRSERKFSRDDKPRDGKKFERSPRKEGESERPFRDNKKPFNRDARPARDENRGERKFSRDDKPRDGKKFERSPRKEGGNDRPFRDNKKPFDRDARPARDENRGERKFSRDDKPRDGKKFERSPRKEGGNDRPFRDNKKPFNRDARPARDENRGERKFSRDDKPRDGKKFERSPRKEGESERPFRDNKKPFNRDARPARDENRGERKFSRDDKPRDGKKFERSPRKEGGNDRPFRDNKKPFNRDENRGERKFSREDKPRPPQSAALEALANHPLAQGKGKPRRDREPTYLDTYQKPKHSFFRAPESDEKRESKPAKSKSGKEVAVAKKHAQTETRRAETQESSSATGSGIRIAKRISDAGICSRRDAERLIAEGRVTVNEERIDTPAILVTPKDYVRVDGDLIGRHAGAPRLFLYHKPRGLLTTTRDPEGRPTVFDDLPKGLPRLISVGRLDLDSEGLLLLTNSGALSRLLELPASGIPRSYLVRILGALEDDSIAQLARGITVEGVEYGPITVTPEDRTTEGRNRWVRVTLHEGKNRELRRVFEHLGHSVSRLIRESYGPFTLGKLPRGTVMEIKPKEWYKALAPLVDLSILGSDN